MPATSQLNPLLVTTCVGPEGDSRPSCSCTPIVTRAGFSPGAGRIILSSGLGVGDWGENGGDSGGGDAKGCAFALGVAAFAGIAVDGLGGAVDGLGGAVDGLGGGLGTGVFGGEGGNCLTGGNVCLRSGLCPRRLL